MPELPEVETVMRGLAPVLNGYKITRLDQRRPDLRIPFPHDFAARLEGKCFLGLRRRGKYILAAIEGGDSLVVHLGMSGSFKILPSGDPVQTGPHDHLILMMENGATVIYNDPRRFGMMFMVATESEENHPAFAAMGPEPLGNGFNGEILACRLKNRSGPVKTALLNQSVIAGIGNIYACEALYMAGISPVRKSSTIAGARAEALAAALKKVLSDAIDSGGSSLRDHKLVNGALGYFQHHFRVYNREGEICPETGDTIKRIVQAGRSTFYCPRKQR